jgi:hypothetical protein
VEQRSLEPLVEGYLTLQLELEVLNTTEVLLQVVVEVVRLVTLETEETQGSLRPLEQEEVAVVVADRSI